MSAVKAVIFDLDGTLADSLDDLADCGNFCLETFGFLKQRTEDYKYLVGDGLSKLIERVLPEDSQTPDIIAKIRDTWLDYYSVHCLDKTRPYDNMPDALAVLKRRGLKLSVVTNKQQELAEKIIGGLYEKNTFDIVCGVKAGVPVKPDPHLAFAALEFMGVLARETIFVGDTSVDMTCAKNAGCVPVGALWGFRTADELKNAGAVHLLHSPSELPDIVIPDKSGGS